MYDMYEKIVPGTVELSRFSVPEQIFVSALGDKSKGAYTHLLTCSLEEKEFMLCISYQAMNREIGSRSKKGPLAKAPLWARRAGVEFMLKKLSLDFEIEFRGEFCRFFPPDDEVVLYTVQALEFLRAIYNDNRRESYFRLFWQIFREFFGGEIKIGPVWGLQRK